MPVGKSHRCVTLTPVEGKLPAGMSLTLNFDNDLMATYVYELLLDGENLRSGEAARQRGLTALRAMREETVQNSAKKAGFETYESFKKSWAERDHPDNGYARARPASKPAGNSGVITWGGKP
jgi:hypothetical protein